MGKRLKDQMEKISQKSVGFPLRQHLFFAENPDFKPDEFCRFAVDEQINLIDPKFLKGGNNETTIR